MVIDKSLLYKLVDDLSKKYEFIEIFPVNLLNSDYKNSLLTLLKKHLPFNDHEFTEKKYQDVQNFLLEFPSRNNNLVNNEQIKDLIAMFRVMRTDSPDLTSYYDDAGDYEDMRQTYWVLRDAQKKNSDATIKRLLEKSDIRALRKNT